MACSQPGRMVPPIACTHEPPVHAMARRTGRTVPEPRRTGGEGQAESTERRSEKRSEVADGRPGRDQRRSAAVPAVDDGPTNRGGGVPSVDFMIIEAGRSTGALRRAGGWSLVLVGVVIAPVAAVGAFFGAATVTS